MPENDVTVTIGADLQTSGALRTLQRDFNRAMRNIQQRTETANRQISSSFTRLNNAISSVSRGVQGFVALMGVRAAFSLGKTVLDTTRRLERFRGGLAALEGGAGAATRAMAELQKVAELPGINLEQAVQARLNLRAVNVEAQLSTRIIKAFGNALAIAGDPRRLNDITIQLQQMVSAGKILTADLRPVLQQMPLMATAMRQAFGTINAQQIEALGISAQDFLSRITSELEKLPKATGGAENAVSNLQNAFTSFTATVGEVLLPAFTAVVNTMTGALNAATSAVDRLRGAGPSTAAFPTGEARAARLRELGRLIGQDPRGAGALRGEAAILRGDRFAIQAERERIFRNLGQVTDVQEETRLRSRLQSLATLQADEFGFRVSPVAPGRRRLPITRARGAGIQAAAAGVSNVRLGVRPLRPRSGGFSAGPIRGINRFTTGAVFGTTGALTPGGFRSPTLGARSGFDPFSTGLNVPENAPQLPTIVPSVQTRPLATPGLFPDQLRGVQDTMQQWVSESMPQLEQSFSLASQQSVLMAQTVSSAFSQMAASANNFTLSIVSAVINMFTQILQTAQQLSAGNLSSPLGIAQIGLSVLGFGATAYGLQQQRDSREGIRGRTFTHARR